MRLHCVSGNETAVFSSVSAHSRRAASARAAALRVRCSAMLRSSAFAEPPQWRLLSMRRSPRRSTMTRFALVLLIAGLAVSAARQRRRPSQPRPNRSPESEPGPAGRGRDGQPLHVPPHRRRLRAARWPHRPGRAMRLEPRPAGPAARCPTSARRWKARSRGCSSENAALKKSLLSRGLELPSGVKADAAADRQGRRDPDARH